MNILDAIQKGYDELQSSIRRERILVVITDGHFTLGSKDQAGVASAALEHLISELAKANIKLYTLTVTNDADRAQLERLTRATGGFASFVTTEIDIQGAFASIFEKIKVPDTVPVDGNAFTIDDGTRFATVVVSKESQSAATLAGPSGRLDNETHHTRNVGWYASSLFDIITIKDPAPGIWRIILSSHLRNRVYVLTDLSLRSSLDKVLVRRGETVTIDAWVEKKGRIVAESELHDPFSFSASITGPSGKTVTLPLAPDTKPGDHQSSTGKFSSSLIVDTAGDYEVKILAQNHTCVRKKVISVRAIESNYLPSTTQGRIGISLPAQSAVNDEFSWLVVLIKFGYVNFVAIVLTIAVIFMKIKLTAILEKKRTQR